MAVNLNSIVDVTIDRITKFPTQAGFGIPAVLDINTTQANDILVVNELTDMTDAGFLAADEAFKAASALLSQNPRPPIIKILKRAANVAQINTYLVVTAPDGTYKITLNGEDHDFVAGSSTVEAIRDGLVTAINGGGQSTLLTAAPVSGDTLTVTSDTAGVGFSSVVASPSGDMTDTATTPNTGAESELTRLRGIDDDFYFLLTTDRTRVFLEQLSTSIEALVKVFAFETDEADSKDLPSQTDTTSLLAVLQAANRERTFSVWTKTSNLGTYIASAWVGKNAPRDPGSITWKFKSVSGPIPDNELTPSEQTNIQNKNGNLYVTVAGFNIFAEGIMASGEFIDIIRGTDLIEARIQENVFFLFVSELKVPFDQGGMEAVALRVEEVLVNVGVGNTILQDGANAPVVTVPDLADVPIADRANRFLDDVEFTAFYAGAIHRTKINGRISV